MKYYYYDYSIRKPLTVIEEACKSDIVKTFDKRIAVQIHLYFPELITEIISYLNNIPFSFDCYISTSSVEKQKKIQTEFDGKCNSNLNVVEVFENKGRDVLPFLKQMKARIDEYDYICHIHSKKSETIEWGDEWRYHLYNNLMGSRDFVMQLFDDFEKDSQLGMVFPEVYPLIQLAARWNGTLDSVKDILRDMNIQCELPREPIFSAGTMFWAKTKAVKPIFELDWDTYHFPGEDGQIDFTPAHAIERLWVYMVQSQNFSYKVVQNAIALSQPNNKRRTLVYQCLKKNNTKFSIEDDVQSVLDMKPYFNHIYFICDTQLDLSQKELLEKNHVIIKECNSANQLINLLDCECDQMVWMNNECFGPITSMYNMFYKMEQRGVDYWTLYANIENGKTVPFSNFIVLEKKILENKDIQEIISNASQYTMNSLCQTVFEIIKSKGLCYQPFTIESMYLNDMIHVKDCTKELPYDFTILNVPFIKKDAIHGVSVDAREAYISLLQQLTLGSKYADKFIKKKENVILRVARKVKRKF